MRVRSRLLRLLVGLINSRVHSERVLVPVVQGTANDSIYSHLWHGGGSVRQLSLFTGGVQQTVNHVSRPEVNNNSM